MGLLKPTDKNWQPQDFLPDPESEEFLDNIKEIQKRAEGVSDDLMVVLVGDMITEEAYTPFTIETEIQENVAFETRGKWEVKNDWMAGPFLNYVIVDKKNDRLLVLEGFTYAPSVDKRNFLLELEAIAKSVVIN